MKQLFDKKEFKNIIILLIGYLFITILIKGGFLNRQYTSLLVPIAVNIMLAVSLNLVTGFLGELSLGHACFMSIGAYSSAIFTINTHLPAAIQFMIALAFGGMMAAIFGFLIGVPVLRLRGDYLAIVTLGFGEIIKSILIAMGGITNGAKGLSKIPLYSNYKNYTVVYLIMAITILMITNLVKSRDDIATESIGIHVSSYKIKAFVISAFFAGIAGVLYAHNVGIIKPTTFDYNQSIEILVIVVLGGMGSIQGSIIAAIILTILPELLRGADNYRMLLYSIALILIMIFNHSKIKEGLMENKTFSRLLPKRGGVEHGAS